MGKHSKRSSSAQTAQAAEKSRKEKRKLQRKQKKEKKNVFYKRRNVDQVVSHGQPIHNKHSQIKNSIQRNKLQQQSNKGKINKQQKQQVLPTKNSQPTKKSLIKKQKINPQNKQTQEQIAREQKQIQYYESLLGVDKKKKNYKNIAKGLGYQDDLFDFLDNITKKVKGDDHKYDGKQQEPSNQDGQMLDEEQEQQISSQNDFQNINDQELSQQQQEQFQEESLEGIQQQEYEDDEDEGQQQQYEQGAEGRESEQYEENQVYSQNNDEDGEFDNAALGDQNDMDEEQRRMWKQLQMEGQNQGQILEEQPQFKEPQFSKPNHNKKNLRETNQKVDKQKTAPAKSSARTHTNIISQAETRKPLFGNLTPQQKQQQQIRKQMNSLFNKLSDGNLMITFRQFSQIFLSASKSNTIPVFINIFVKFNVEVQKPHLHILLSNIALASALHHLMGNRLMAPLVYEIVKKFDQYQNTEEDLQEIQQIGYSKLFQRKKNVIIMLSYFYDFGSVTGEFISNLVSYLSKSLNQHNIQFLYIIIQKVGNKIRQNDPGILKEIIEVLKQSIQAFKTEKASQTSQITKINIIEVQLNQLKFNRKMPLFSDQRMAFFSTFLVKNVPKQLNTQKQILLANYQQIKHADTSRTNWWQCLQKDSQNPMNQNSQNQEQFQILNELTSQRKQLLQLAKSLNLVTQIRKNIFVQIMQASDYIQATQKVLALKIKNLQQIAIVLVQICVLEPTFNPFYPLVGAKIASLMPKFKSKIQFVIWDHIKLLESYNARKTSNLAKFAARFVGNTLSNGSLSILKYFADLVNIPPFESMFLIIFFTEFFAFTKKPAIVQISTKLKQQSNRQIKQSILEYFAQVGVREKGFNNMEKMKFLRRMIMLNEDQNEERQRQ